MYKLLTTGNVEPFYPGFTFFGKDETAESLWIAKKHSLW